ncbi:LysE family translocator [Mycetocola tolaasinivorans]|uniref:LysE family translocator n=1 Tax=Mycetocola tolaasinivorans TaxID=76635 RepID=A0A3L7A5B4_9MICO|nr:LysE family translocator [Mycetocola tolaasinivorans]RLP75040.1 LysE family translocator [Mycetocola tolaasinivorans]
MNPTLIAQFWLVAVLLVLTPGADWAYAIAAGLRAKSVAPAILGMAAAYSLVVVVLALGVGALVTAQPITLTVLSLLGSGYLIYLGTSTVLQRSEGLAASDRPLNTSALPQFLRGMAVSGLNPKGLLLLLTLLPQFLSPTGWPASGQMLVLGSLHVINGIVVYTIVALLARKLLRTRPRASQIVTRGAGVAMLAVGIGILVEQAVRVF